MGPPPFGDGNANSGLPSIGGAKSFNGATAFRRWKLCEQCNNWSCKTWLQWGHRLSAMETSLRNPCCWQVAVLQWGHRLSAMETAACSEASQCISKLQWGHRLSAMETVEIDRQAHDLAQASMGPPPFGDGNRQVRGLPEGAGKASMGPPPFGDGNRPGPRRPGRSCGSFNGATAFRRWKPDIEDAADHDHAVASMGPPPFGDGNEVEGSIPRPTWS